MHVRPRPVARLTLCAVFATTAWASVAAADSSSEQALYSATNSARERAGLAPYAGAGDLTTEARRWAAWMAAHRTLEHNPALTAAVCCWRDLGENVGRGGSAASVQRSFMGSPPHRANILSATYTQVGIGTARGSDGQLYVDEVFRHPRSSRASTATSLPAVPVRPAPPRASRGVRRATVPAPLEPARLDRRVALVRHRLRPAGAHADPVLRAVLYASALRAVAG